MRRPELYFLLSAFGIVLPACGDAHGDAAQSHSSALESDPTVDAYYEGKAFHALSPEVAAAVKDALAAAPGPEARTAMVALFSAPKWLMLGAALDSLSCVVVDGRAAQLLIAQWAKATSTQNPQEPASDADSRTAANMVAIRTVLFDLDVRHVDPTLAAIQKRLANAAPPFTLQACSGGGGSTTNAGGSSSGGGATTSKGGGSSSGGGATTSKGGSSSSSGGGATTSKGGSSGGSGGGATTNSGGGSGSSSGGSTTRARLAPHANADMPAHTILSDMFAQVEQRAPSRSMQAEWSALRSTYRAKLAGSGPAVRELLRQARHEGSSTLGRSGNGGATQKFDDAAQVVDQLARRNVRFSTDAMNLVHSMVADRDQGRIRTAGQDVKSGSDESRLYLPGSQVHAAVADLFRAVQAQAAGGAAAPRLAAMFDRRMISIHPFMDANGRTTRLMTDWLLTREAYPPVVLGKDAVSSALFWQKSGVDRDMHLERITEGMRRAVGVVASVVG
jgi:hypothetical protein